MGFSKLEGALSRTVNSSLLLVEIVMCGGEALL